MSDLIDRQAAMDALDRIFDQCEEIEAHLPKGDPGITGYKMYPDYMIVWEYLHQLPAADPKRRKGRWLIEYLDGIPGRRAEIKYCSECCQVSPYRHNFCPNCGADMRGE